MGKNRPAGQKERRSTASAAGLRLTLTVLHAKNPAKKEQNTLDTADMVTSTEPMPGTGPGHFLAGAVAIPFWAGAQGNREALSGPALLTVNGQIGAGNRGPLN